MILSVMLTGCEFFGPGPSDSDPGSTSGTEQNYIIVTVKARVQAIFENRSFDTGEPFDVIALAGRNIKIKITKAGGENAIFNKITDSGGFTDLVDATFNVYKEQPVDVFADFSSKQSFPFEYAYGYEKFTWEQIWEVAGGFGEPCTFSSSLTVKEIDYNVP